MVAAPSVAAQVAAGSLGAMASDALVQTAGIIEDPCKKYNPEATLAAGVAAAVSGTPSILLGAAGLKATGAALVFQGLVDLAYGTLAAVTASAIAGD